ncbi:MAG: 2-aminoethylphosphonate--pyruvate transaminase [Pseudomonadota bacterium]|nr:2-aminoethylphosphonate--pyruvate transaminase [Pseudomonadota bacterium]
MIRPIKRRFKGPNGQEDMPYLLTPGPLTTSRAVKLAMLADWGSWDSELKFIVAETRRRLLRLAGCDESYTCVLMQGSGSFGIEAALGSFAPIGRKKLLMITNGAYGDRAVKMLQRLNRPHYILNYGDSQKPAAGEVDRLLVEDPMMSAVFMVHCETTSGIVNPLHDIAAAVKKRNRLLILDAMSSFGAIPIDMAELGVDVMISSANKCIEGVPGFYYVLCRRDMLKDSKNHCHSLSLDLFEQWDHMEKTGQFRYTPPTHTLVAFYQALKEHEKEGGIAGRLARYMKNRDTLLAGMKRLGFHTLLAPEDAGPIIQTFLTPRDRKFDFQRFYDALKLRGFVIYPGKLTRRPSFRIGNIGQIDAEVMQALVEAVRETLREMGVRDMTPDAEEDERRAS